MIEPTARMSGPVAAEQPAITVAPVRSPGADILAIAFGATVAMWAVGYFCRLPRSLDPAGPLQVLVPGWVLLLGMIACMLAAGYFAGRYTRRGIKGGLCVGLLSALLNLMVLGSLLRDPQAGAALRSAAIWVPGSFLFAALVGMIGAAIGRTRSCRCDPINWLGVFTKVAVAAVGLLLLAGGLVTSQEAGLAVVDWPNTEGDFMFLYPLSRMTGGIYYEHAHRLFGSLLGLTTLVLAVYLWLYEPRRPVRRLIGMALVAVIVQGILGGLRVTGKFTMTTNPSEVAPSTALAVVHGIFGQIVFVVLAIVAVATSTSWYNTTPAPDSPRRSTDRTLLSALFILLVVQLTIGALQRHMGLTVIGPRQMLANYTLITHVVLGTLLVAWGAITGLRTWGLYEHFPTQARLGLALIGLSSMQLLLGLGSLVVTGLRHNIAAQPTPPTYEVIVTALHQTVGALMLACVAALGLWIRREPMPHWRQKGLAPAG